MIVTALISTCTKINLYLFHTSLSVSNGFRRARRGMYKNNYVQVLSTPGGEGAEYIAVCLPAFSPDTIHRDDD